MAWVDTDRLKFPFQQTKEMVRNEMKLKYGVDVSSESLDDIANFIYDTLLDTNNRDDYPDDYYSGGA